MLVVNNLFFEINKNQVIKLLVIQGVIIEMKRLLSVTLLILSLLFLLSVSPVFAAEHVVTDLDGGTDQPGSLRNILLYVVSGDVITFQEGLSGEIYLEGSILLEKDLTIQGPGADLITINGSLSMEEASLIMINQDVNAVISGLSFVSADAGIQNGAAISNAGNLRLSDCLFQNNLAAQGGAISNGTGFIVPVASMDIVNCQFLSNQADWGGAIYNTGNLKIVSSDLYGNVALTVGGGAIYNYQDLVIENSELINNQALSGGGGAILTNMGKLTLNDTLLNYNEALDNGQGGAIYSRNAEGGIFLIGCTLDGNKARNGGAIRNYDYENYHSEGISLSLTNCILKNNEAQYGGGIYSNPRYNKTILTNCIIAGNTATESAGGIHTGNNNLEMRKCTFSGNIAGSSGGGIYSSNIESYVTRLWNCTIAGNVVSSDLGYGGGGVLAVNGAFQTSNCTITGNSAPKGGGLSVLNSYIGMKNTIIAFNESETSGDIFVEPTGSGSYSTSSGYNMAGGDPYNWFVDVGDTVLSDDITSADVFDGFEEGIEVGSPGFTERMQVPALKVGSIAIDRGHWNDLFELLVSEDQRGVSRPQGDYNDIGAYERELVSYSITTTVTAGGNIDPVSADVPEGADQTFTVTPYDGYILSDLLDGEESVSADMDGNDFTFTNVVEGHTLNAAFIIDPIMKEEAGVGDFQVENEGIGSITSYKLVNEEDIKSLNMGGISSGDVEGLIGDEGADTNNFVSGFSFDVNYSDDEGNDIFALDVTLDISREDLGQDICDAVDAGDDLAVAFFENISIYKIVSPDAFDLFEVASEDHEQPLNFFEVTSDDSSYHVSMSMVIEDNETPGSADTLEAVEAGMDSYFYVYDGVADGKFTDPLVAVSKTSETPPVEDGDNTAINGGDGCNFGLFSPMVTMILLPLLFFLRK